jgi:biotin synthase
MLTHPSAMDDSCGIIQAFTLNTDLPVSVLLCPSIMGGEVDFHRIKTAGADRVGIAIDAATEPLFDALRGKGVKGPHIWERYQVAIDDAVRVFGAYNAGVHLIVGLGETEREMVQIIDDCHNRGALTHLFSFYPEPGSFMESHPRPCIESYRKIQIARYLINESICDITQFTFTDMGELMDFGIDIEPYIKIGSPFMTSGCPGKDGILACNRPYSNERPSEPIRNFYFTPDEEDIKMISTQINA